MCGRRDGSNRADGSVGSSLMVLLGWPLLLLLLHDEELAVAIGKLLELCVHGGQEELHTRNLPLPHVGACLGLELRVQEI